jgi:hypothetical protein|tara:strand:+ start:1490 stop:1801 length:312 start_codon:yes stop_codon:yes gene_type:complete
MTKKETIDISENNGILSCTIEIPPRNYQFPHTLVYKTKNVVELLTKQGYKIDQILEETTVHNKSTKDNAGKGIWRFKLHSAHPPKKTTKARTRTSKPTTSKKY